VFDTSYEFSFLFHLHRSNNVTSPIPLDIDVTSLRSICTFTGNLKLNHGLMNGVVNRNCVIWLMLLT
jgi:hypothetical protein